MVGGKRCSNDFYVPIERTSGAPDVVAELLGR